MCKFEHCTVEATRGVVLRANGSLRPLGHTPCSRRTALSGRICSSKEAKNPGLEDFGVRRTTNLCHLVIPGLV